MSSHYDPNQPRVPAEHQGGGRWTGGAFGERNNLHSTFHDRQYFDAEHSGRYGDQQERNVRLAFLDTQKPPIRQPLASPPPRIVGTPKFLFPLRSIPYIGAAITLFSLLSQFNDDEQQAIIAFKSREFTRPGEGPFDLEGVRTLTESEVETICGDGFKDVRQLVNEAYDKLSKQKLSESKLGTAVHKEVEDRIPELKNDNLTPERTYEKNRPSDSNRPEQRGAKESIRVDVRNKVNDETVCIDEIKTGWRELTFSRMNEIVRREVARNSGVKRIIVTEVVPRNARIPKPPRTLQSE